MNYLLCMMLLTQMNTTMMIFDFHDNAPVNQWNVVDDVVMGGRSSGSFYLSDEGHGIFEGKVSLENDGGFSSVRYRFEKKQIDPSASVQIRLKGDGKSYQFRVKDRASNYFTYIYLFQTSGEWETITIPLAKMYPGFRGRKLDMSNFSEEMIEEIAFLIANKRNESFKLVVDKIVLVKN